MPVVTGECFMKRTTLISWVSFLVLFAIGVLLPDLVFAHCDGMDGPVVKAAQKALETGNVNLVLIWVQKKDEDEIKKAFQKILAVRKLNPQTRELADMYFFETLVRIHRAGEGEPYTGLKPAGRDLGPAIPAADKALESGKAEPLVKLLIEATQAGVPEKFKEVLAKKKFKPDDVEAGREYVEAYVSFLEYIERIYEAAKSPAGGHSEESRKAGLPKEEKC
jgi:Family of unknown function (DUF6448)